MDDAPALVGGEPGPDAVGDDGPLRAAAVQPGQEAGDPARPAAGQQAVEQFGERTGVEAGLRGVGEDRPLCAGAVQAAEHPGEDASAR